MKLMLHYTNLLTNTWIRHPNNTLTSKCAACFASAHTQIHCLQSSHAVCFDIIFSPANCLLSESTVQVISFRQRKRQRCVFESHDLDSNSTDKCEDFRLHKIQQNLKPLHIKCLNQSFDKKSLHRVQCVLLLYLLCQNSWTRKTKKI